MANNILLIVEGSKDEKNVFGDIFESYGFSTTIIEDKLTVEGLGVFKKHQYELKNNSIVIVEGPRNRIHDILKLFKDENVDIEKAFSYDYAFFKGIFLIYDVDHNDCDDIKEMFEHFNDESRGLLLLSSPCLEVLAEYDKDRKEEKYHHLKEYKSIINAYYHGATRDFIKNNFNELALYYLTKNEEEFDEPNVMEHPRLIIDKINLLNERVNFEEKEKSYVIYRYFTTVIYVAIAFANSLTKEIDNYQQVYEFFKSKSK